jgi:hypothetical protein
LSSCKQKDLVELVHGNIILIDVGNQTFANASRSMVRHLTQLGLNWPCHVVFVKDSQGVPTLFNYKQFSMLLPNLMNSFKVLQLK